MSLKFPPEDYIPVDYNLLVSLLAKKYDQQNVSSNMTDSNENLDIIEYYDFPETQVENGIILYLSPFLLFFSTIGNILSLVILSRLCYEVWSACVYLAIISLFDQFMIYTWCGNEWLNKVAYVDISNELLMSSVSICKVYTFLFSAVIHMQKWLMVCMSIELFIATKFPHKVPEMCTLSRAKAVILLLTVILACVNIHYFWTYEVVNVNHNAGVTAESETYMCIFVKQGVSYSAIFEDLIWPIIDVSIAQVFPLIIIATFTILTIIQFIKGPGQEEYQEENWRKKYLLYPHAMKQLKISVLVICIFYILTVPRLLITLFRKFLEWKTDVLGFQQAARLQLTSTIFSYFEFTFLSLKFYVLFICCKQFRAEFFNICRRLCRSKKKESDTDSDEIQQTNNSHFWQNQHSWISRICRQGNHQSQSSKVPSKRSLMASNPSSIEFQTDTTMQTNHSLSYLCPHHATVTTVTDVEHTIV